MHLIPLGLFLCIFRPVVGLIHAKVVCVATTFAYSDPGPANFCFSTIALAFSVKDLATSSKHSLDVVEVEDVEMVEVVVEIFIMINSLKICHSIISGRPCNKSKTALNKLRRIVYIKKEGHCVNIVGQEFPIVLVPSGFHRVDL